MFFTTTQAIKNASPDPNPEGGGKVMLGILGGGVPPDSPNPDLISDQKCHLSVVSDLAFKIHTRFQTRNYVIIT